MYHFLLLSNIYTVDVYWNINMELLSKYLKLTGKHIIFVQVNQIAHKDIINVRRVHIVSIRL